MRFLGKENDHDHATKIATILVVAWIGFLVWAGITGKFNSPKTEPDPCEQVTDKASPIHIGLRVLPGTSEQQFIECYRKHETFKQAVRRMEFEESYKWVSDREKVKQIVDKEMEKYGPPTTSEDELIRLSKMTQEERDREVDQRRVKFPRLHGSLPWGESAPERRGSPRGSLRKTHPGRPRPDESY